MVSLSQLRESDLLELQQTFGEEYPRFNFEDLMAMSTAEIGHLRAWLEVDFCAFCRFVFRLIRGVEYLWAAPQQRTYDALRGVELGLTKRLIINEPPRFGKTELVEVLWPAWHIIKNPRSCWLVVCRSDELVRLNSATVRDIIQLAEIQFLWPKVVLSPHTKDKSLWMTTHGGYFRAVSLEGQITGFGAGRLNAKWFAGALILADLLKAQEIRSVTRMETVNQFYTTVLKNRTNDKNTPIIVEAQRLHDSDLSGFLLGGGSGEYWHHARIPAGIFEAEEAQAKSRYAVDWNHGIPLDFNLPLGYVWPDKYGEEQDLPERIDEESWSAQRMQNPRLTKGAFIRVSWFRRYEEAKILGGLVGRVIVNGEQIDVSHMEVFADTAVKTKEANDYSVFQLWGRGVDGNIYLLDQLRGKWEAPELESVSTEWLKKYEDVLPRRFGWRCVNIEDKSSGCGLIQQLKRKWGARVNPIPRSTDKISRALGICLPLEAGRVFIPRVAPWLPEYLAEFASFNKQMTHAHDDQVDPTIDAIVKMLEKQAGEMYRYID